MQKDCPPEGNSECYCIPSGDCFPYVQAVNIDHCNFDRHKDNRLQIKYTVTNQAGLTRTGFVEVSDWNSGNRHKNIGIIILICERHKLNFLTWPIQTFNGRENKKLSCRTETA